MLRPARFAVLHNPFASTYEKHGRERRYGAHFVSKLTDCDGENSGTDSSLDFANDCNYITAKEHTELTLLCQEIGKMRGRMIRNPKPFLSVDI